MATKRQKVTQKRGRPVKLTWPAPIPDTLENVARAVLRTRTKAERDEIYRRPS